MIINIGYHTLEDRGNATQIEESGPIGCKKVSIAWLGFGYYFWDTDIFWAHNWGKNYPAYLVFEAKIRRDENLFDLFGDVGHILQFLDCAKQVKEMQENDGDILVPDVIEYIKARTRFTALYSAIRCADYPDRPNVISFRRGRPEKMIIGGERVQYCLLNQNNIIKNSFRLIYPENL
jgi:hypothetical protein